MILIGQSFLANGLTANMQIGISFQRKWAALSACFSDPPTAKKFTLIIVDERMLVHFSNDQFGHCIIMELATICKKWWLVAKSRLKINLMKQKIWLGERCGASCELVGKINGARLASYGGILEGNRFFGRLELRVKTRRKGQFRLPMDLFYRIKKKNMWLSS